ncbi:hypothetical protein ACFFYR_01735 [Paraburkholderia dipogonis]|uniref:hypothetical protein n=1 Tax=Paraburkholderia dipogonis TaxID=1211383 RepID=UPI0035EBD015
MMWQSPTEDNSIAKWWPTVILTIFLIELVRKVIFKNAIGSFARPTSWQTSRVASFARICSKKNKKKPPVDCVAYFDDFMRIVPNWRKPSAVCERNARAGDTTKPPENLD